MADDDGRSPAQPDDRVNAVHNDARDVSGNVVQVGSVTGDVNVSSGSAAVIAGIGKVGRIARDCAGFMLILLLLLAVNTPQTTWSVLGVGGPEDGPEFDTAHVGDCMAPRGRIDWSNAPARDLPGGPATVTVVPCWHRSALYRVVAVTPFDLGEAAGESPGTDWDELQEQACAFAPGWDDGIALSGYDYSPVFCLAFT